MKYRVEKRGSVISVRIDDVAGQEQALIERICRCRQSAWACPSGECQNIGTIEERVEGGSVFLALIPAPGAQIDRSGIEICLRYTLASRTLRPAAG
jgi:hypothetical protein